MSVWKRIWIDRDPAFEKERTVASVEFDHYARDFVHRLPSIRYELAMNGKKRRSPRWRSAVRKALEETQIDSIRINDGVFFRAKAERDHVGNLANQYLTRATIVPVGSVRPTREEYLASRFEASLRNKNTTIEAEREKAREAGTDCPDCGHPMTVRTSRKGRNAGARFMGCRMYPACKGTRQMSPARTQARV